MNVKVFYLLFCLLIISDDVFAQFEGDSCTTVHNGGSGICKKAYDCPEVVALFRQGIKFTTCSYTSASHIVCCPVNSYQFQSQTSQIYPAQNSYSNWRGMSAKKCAEYKSKLKSHTAVAGLTVVLKPSIISSDTCSFSTGLIVGGTKAVKGEFPHSAALGQRGVDERFFCGGSLISERFILTVSHCFAPGGNIFARLGDLNIKSSSDGNGFDYNIISFIKHENYNRNSRQNDIALAKTDREVMFDTLVRPACLWQENYFETSSVIAIGWGATGYGETTSDDLLKVNVDILSLDKCVKNFDGDESIVINGNQICAGVLAGGRDTCQGDSGGSIQTISSDNKCMYNLIGLTSFGGVCGSVNSPSVYTRISSYIQWIEEKIYG